MPANLTNLAGDTPLMPAAYYGNPETVRVPIERGADVTLSAVDAAVTFERTEYLGMLGGAPQK